MRNPYLPQKSNKPFQETPSPYAPVTPKYYPEDAPEQFSLSNTPSTPAPAGDFSLNSGLVEQPLTVDSLMGMSSVSPFVGSWIKVKEIQGEGTRVLNGLINGLNNGVSTKDAAAKTGQIIKETKVEEARRKYQEFLDKQKDIVPENAPTTAYDIAMNAYQQLAQAFPTAPERNVREVTEQQRIMAALASVLGIGGQGQAGINMAMAPEMAAQQQADMDYKAGMDRFSAQNNTWENQMKAAGIGVNSERQLLMDNQDTLNRRYDSRVRVSQAEEKKFFNAIEQANDNQRMDFANAQKDWDSIVDEMWADDEITEKERQELEAKKELFLSNYGLTKPFGIGLKVPDVGYSARRIEREAKREVELQKFRQTVFAQDQTNAYRYASLRARTRMFYDKLKSVEKIFGLNLDLNERKFAWDKAMDEVRSYILEQGLDLREFDSLISAQNAQFSGEKTVAELQAQRNKATENYSKAIQDGDTEKAEESKSEELALTRQINTLKGSLSKRPPVPTRVITGGRVSKEEVTAWKEEFLKEFGDAKPEQDGKGSVPNSAHKSGTALDLRYGDPKRDNPEQLASMFQYAVQQQVPYIIFNRMQYKLNPATGKYTPSPYKGPSPHVDHVHVDWHIPGTKTQTKTKVEKKDNKPTPTPTPTNQPPAAQNIYTPSTTTGMFLRGLNSVVVKPGQPFTTNSGAVVTPAGKGKGKGN
jgi:hypothetical protein